MTEEVKGSLGFLLTGVSPHIASNIQSVSTSNHFQLLLSLERN